VLIEEGLQMTRELYLSIVLDRAAGKPVIMASAAGGMDIEEVAEKTPEKIVRVYVEPGVGIVPFEARQLGFGIGLDGAQVTSSSRWSRRSTTPIWRLTRRCSRSIRWSSRRLAICLRSTPR
jgi:Succinyl-CoA synthetase, beta subunit